MEMIVIAILAYSIMLMLVYNTEGDMLEAGFGVILVTLLAYALYVIFDESDESGRCDLCGNICRIKQTGSEIWEGDKHLLNPKLCQKCRLPCK